ncbi:MAG: lysophospholipid acyltransferase family protein [Desulfobacca sp.]|uniref:lysophospholipid acyltransferase family protein n=1 Tax=Desulfobacca sp. TaxID=2067990 RepID=UPI00404ADB32
MLVTVWFYFVLVITTIIASTLVILVTALKPQSELPLRITHYWGIILLRCAGVDLQVEGLENLDLSRPYVFAANHQSGFDIFALLAALPRVKFLAKKELFRIPLFGPALARTGSLPIDRSNRQAALKSIELAAAAVRQGSSIVIFPEGTRSTTKELLPFKKGGFVLAIKSGQPIVPVSLSGTGNVLPRGRGRIQSGPIKVVFGQPIATDAFKNVNKDEIMTLLREAIGKNYDPDYGQRSQKPRTCGDPAQPTAVRPA